jgi:hypothetical protein
MEALLDSIAAAVAGVVVAVDRTAELGLHNILQLLALTMHKLELNPRTLMALDSGAELHSNLAAEDS